jgi:predicted dehydrogenase
LGSHLIDQVVFTYGMPDKITAFIVEQRQGDTKGYKDSFTVLLHYPGLLATLKAGVVSAEQDQLRFWVRGTRASYKKFHLDPQEEQLRAGKMPGEHGFGIEAPEKAGQLTVADGKEMIVTKLQNVLPETYVRFYAGVAEALAGRGDMPVKAEGAMNVIRLIELAQKSSDEGRTLDV